MPSFEGNLLTHEISSQGTGDSRLSYGENPESISPGLESVPGRDRWTDRITIASTRLALRAVARKKITQSEWEWGNWNEF